MGATVTQQIQQTQQQQAYAGGDYAERLVRVEKDVSALNQAMTSLASSVDKGFRDLTGDLKARSSINWQPIGLLITVLTVIGGMGFSWINMGQGRLETLIAKQEARAERYVPREDLDTRFHVITQRRDDLQRLTDSRVERTERDLDTLAKQVVPRGEHTEVWTGQRMKDDGLQRQIDGLRKDLSDLNTPRDTIQGMQRRIDELERGRRPPG